jgi:hypothetical protein
LSSIASAPTAVEVREYLASVVDWQRFFRLVDHVGQTLNNQKDRFDKASILELGIEVYSIGQIKWIDDRRWIDHQFTLKMTTVKVSMKFDHHLLTTKNGGTKSVAHVQLVNTRGDGKSAIEALRRDFDSYLMLVDHRRVVVLDPGYVRENGKPNGDQIRLTVTRELAERSQIFTRTRHSTSTVIACDYRDKKIAMIRKVVEDVV